MKKNKLPSKPDSGFIVPDNYFSGFEEKMMDSVFSSGSLENITKSGTGFNVPVGYFENVEREILSKTTKKAPVSNVISLFKKRSFYYAAAVAAIFTGIITSVLFIPTTPTSIQTVEITAIEDYLESGSTEFSYSDISSFLFEEGYEVENANTYQFNDGALLDYLEENIEDPMLVLE